MERKKTISRFQNIGHFIFTLTLVVFNNQVGHVLGKTESYDFIVAGGGVAGCSIAGRLAQTGIYKVLLIEAGGMPDPEWKVPALAFEAWQNPISKDLHTYRSVPQNNAILARDGIADYTVAKVLGGGSAVNGMFWVRGHPMDFSKWARDSFDNNWGYEKLLPYFKKSENYTGEFPSDQRGYDGPITVSSSRYGSVSDMWLKAGLELGYTIADSNSPQRISFAPVDWSQKNRRRVSSYDGYIKPLIGTEGGRNLRILLNTEATEIIFDGNRAIGVKYKTNSTGVIEEGEARASKEIIISAGVVGSPVLLLKSGIGPRPFMNAAKIPVVQYLTGVGRNLQDHLSTGLPIIVKNSSMVYDGNEDLNPRTWQLYERFRTGPYSSYGGAAGQAFIASRKPSTNWTSTMENGWPDTHMIMMYSKLNFINEEYQQLINQELNEGESWVTLLTLIGRPQSRGTILLDAQNLTAPPLIDFRYLTNRADLQVAVEGMKTAMKIVKTRAFQKVGARLPRTPYPKCSHLKINSDEYWRCYVRYISESGIHGCCTCRIGVGPTDHQAVVDRELRVIGINGLRIADASVMPNMINGNPQASIYAIAEKAADLILNTWITSIPPKKEDAYYAVHEMRARYTFKDLNAK